MSLKHQAPRGTRDLLPGEIERWQWAEARARDVLEHYGYREIRTPIFEEYELFARTSGEGSDVVQKEMYRFTDLGERELALRPEGTASVCRAYLQHGMAQQGRIHRLWYMGPMFRYGRPQKGRYRQFRQVGAEIIGTAAPGADSQQRLETNPLRVLDTKSPEELALLEDPSLGPMPRLLEVLDDESRAH